MEINIKISESEAEEFARLHLTQVFKGLGNINRIEIVGNHPVPANIREPAVAQRNKIELIKLVRAVVDATTMPESFRGIDAKNFGLAEAKQYVEKYFNIP